MINIKLPVGLMSVNCYIVGDKKEAIVVDPGGNKKKIIDTLKENDIKVKYILLTHCHFDQILESISLKKETGAEIVAGYKEKENLLRSDINYTNRYSKTPIEIEADIYLSSNDILKSGDFEFKVIETPGHTSGSMCLYCESEKILISGDTLFFESLGRCDLATGNEEDIIKSIKTKLFILPEDVVVMPGHGEITTIGHEKRNNPYIY